ncbi:MAG: radical SAM protein [Deltaproteobacteria bacterium]|nr:radical SAM protein [Deltaproteobacteria bacterium]
MNIGQLVSWSKILFSSQSRYLLFHVTSMCNARCKHCFYWESIESKNYTDNLTLDEIEMFSSYLPQQEIINLCGAEAFLRHDLADITEIFSRKNKVNIIAIPSNGILTDQILKKAQSLLSRFPHIAFRMTISIDALGDVHDQFRGVQGCFEKATRTLAQLCELKKHYKNLLVLTNTTFSASTQNSILETLSYLVDNFDLDTISMTMVRGDPKDPSQRRSLDLKKYREAVQYVTRYGRKGFKAHPLADFIWNATCYTRERVAQIVEKTLTHPSTRGFTCSPTEDFLVIENNGDIKLCEIIDKSLGNLRKFNYRLDQILELPETRKLVEHVKSGADMCNGCTWECAMRSSIISSPMEYPKLGAYVAKQTFSKYLAA